MDHINQHSLHTCQTNPKWFILLLVLFVGVQLTPVKSNVSCDSMKSSKVLTMQNTSLQGNHQNHFSSVQMAMDKNSDHHTSGQYQANEQHQRMSCCDEDSPCEMAYCQMLAPSTLFLSSYKLLTEINLAFTGISHQRFAIKSTFYATPYRPPIIS
ncbi:hypothetical protein [Aliikangiella maris]|uniref:Uncharacterized protein n=2 Tax=Aliikangiella maris TaxID=3162458 RepID=A0ABV3MPU9_9GAMM